MKKLFLILTISLAFMGSAVARTVEVEATQCYCSDKCGPRDIGSKEGDAPFVDPETQIFFCQEDDHQNYKPNECDLKACPGHEEAQEETNVDVDIEGE